MLTRISHPKQLHVPSNLLTFIHCHVCIALDSILTKTQDVYVLLAAGIDADNHATLLAWAIIDNETGGP